MLRHDPPPPLNLQTLQQTRVAFDSACQRLFPLRCELRRVSVEAVRPRQGVEERLENRFLTFRSRRSATGPR
jgi:hypothetical protein